MFAYVELLPEEKERLAQESYGDLLADRRVSLHLAIRPEVEDAHELHVRRLRTKSHLGASRKIRGIHLQQSKIFNDFNDLRAFSFNPSVGF